MNKAKVAKYLESVLPDSHKPFIKYMLVDGIGLESDGWKITVKDGLCFQTPTLIFYPENDPAFTSSSRYLLIFKGFYTPPDQDFQLWKVKALDKKKWWPKDHPNASGSSICM